MWAAIFVQNEERDLLSDIFYNKSNSNNATIIPQHSFMNHIADYGQLLL